MCRSIQENKAVFQIKYGNFIDKKTLKKHFKLIFGFKEPYTGGNILLNNWELCYKSRNKKL